ncbi:MAG: peptidyl-prolyl cis-trans isomerase [Flavobacteriales bacterium]
MLRFLFLAFLTTFLVSCDFLKQDEEKLPIARVNETYLFLEDIKNIVSEDISPQDSLLMVTNYINRWATKQLLLDQSKINLPQKTQDEFNKLVKDYKSDLYSDAYKNAIISQQLDTIITKEQYINYYNKNKENFKLNDELLKIRYLKVEKRFNDFVKLKEKFKRFNQDDIDALKKLSLQFISYNLNDSVWVQKEKLLEILPILHTNTKQVLKKSNFKQLQDSLGVYLIKIEDKLNTNDIAPLSFVKNTIKQIILNKRKLELVKKLEKDITKDALKNKKFEIYKQP